LQALAMAKGGDFAGAQTLIDTTAPDCYLCLRIRGQIAAEMRNWPAAEHWFREAVRQAPSLPFAYADWGAERLSHDDPDGAVAVLRQGHETAPHYADALELTGEALMRKGDYHGAAAQFRSTDAAAPQWGRNHLHWGESLLRLGREREAKAQLDSARRLAISASDRAELGALGRAAPDRAHAR